jgi:hypothetical protein
VNFNATAIQEISHETKFVGKRRGGGKYRFHQGWETDTNTRHFQGFLGSQNTLQNEPSVSNR